MSRLLRVLEGVDLLPVGPQVDQQIDQRLQQGGEAAIPCGPEVELHVRDVLMAGEWHYAVCSCGWCSLPLLSALDAVGTACEIEMQLALSAERRRQLMRRLA